MNDAYQKLKNHSETVHLLTCGSSIISWDMETMMPQNAAEERSQILATLSAVIHEKATLPHIADWLHDAKTDNEWDERNLQILKQDYALEVATPEKLVFKISELQNKTTMIWQEAKPENDWKKVEPLLTELFDAIKERAHIHARILDRAPYDAALFGYARGNTQKKIDPLFAQLQSDLPPLIQQIIAKQQNILYKEFSLSVEQQQKIARDLAMQIGYDFNRGRLDVAAHPFSGGTSNDSRITTRYSATDPLSGFYGVLHEVGHALYSQNTPVEYYGQPVGADRDLSIHESQSLITEKQAGLSDEFIGFLYRFIVERAPEFAQQGSEEDFKNTLHRVRPNFIRIDADEATYPLHIVLRYEIEKKIFADEIKVSDIPELWNSLFHELFGIEVPEHKFGCMQDIHWYWGLVGYFPTYTQGALYAAQLFHAMQRDLPDIRTALGQGNFTPFNHWLKESIRRYGQRYDAPELIQRATDHAPDAAFFLHHLTRRYLG